MAIFLRAVASVGDFGAFEMLMHQVPHNTRQLLAAAILPDIGYSSSAKFFELLTESFPECDLDLDQLIKEILRWERLDLFYKVLELVLQGMNEADQTSYITKTL